jgi:hypothetical protein
MTADLEQRAYLGLEQRAYLGLEQRAYLGLEQRAYLGLEQRVNRKGRKERKGKDFQANIKKKRANADKKR